MSFVKIYMQQIKACQLCCDTTAIMQLITTGSLQRLSVLTLTLLVCWSQSVVLMAWHGAGTKHVTGSKMIFSNHS